MAATQHCCAEQNGNKTKAKYKGLERMLRRIAFNLGNSPSQTEVKIISCIPIDVSDLQQKILTLEKQLEKKGGKQCCSKPQTPYCPSLIECCVLDESARRPRSSRKKKYRESDLILNRDDSVSNKILSRDRSRSKAENVFGPIIPAEDRTRLVYYATAATRPFSCSKKAVDTRKKDTSHKSMEQDYLSSVIDRQATVKMYMDDEMLGSQGSAPVCRDMPRVSTGTSDDLCSCCHGNFLNVDCKIRKRPVYNLKIDTEKLYCDSSFFDMIPVRDNKPFNKTKCIRKRARDLACEYYQFKPEYRLRTKHSLPRDENQERRTKPVICYPNSSSATEGLVEFSHVYPKRLSPKQGYKLSTDKSVTKTAEGHNSSEHPEWYTKLPEELIETPVAKHSSKSSNRQAVDTTKALQTSLFESIHKRFSPTLRNASCLAIPSIEIQCQTDSIKGAHSEVTVQPEANKTESTLNQIKTMLETVLTEVKTNNGIRAVVHEKETKDAVVQNETGSGSDCERYLNSFTYSPYSMMNPFVASHGVPTYCSSVMRQTLTVPRQVEMHPAELNCMPTFPEVHQPMAHACFPERNIMTQTKEMLTCATNTTHEPPKKQNTETENLIKEIYRSIKMDVECPLKSGSRTAIDDAKKNVRKSSPDTKLKIDKIVLGREEMIFRGDVSSSRPREQEKIEPPRAKYREGLESRSSQMSFTRWHRRSSLHQQARPTTSAQRRQTIGTGPKTDASVASAVSASDSEGSQLSTSPAKTSTKPVKGFLVKVLSSVVKKMRKTVEQQSKMLDKLPTAISQDSGSSARGVTSSRPRRTVKHVSYAPTDPQAWREGAEVPPRNSTSRTGRLGAPQGRRPERPVYQTQRMPRYVPRSALRLNSGSSQVRRAIYKPQPPSRPRTPPEYMKGNPHNQYEWRTTPTVATTLTRDNEFKPRLVCRGPGLKITNKSWMRKPVHHLGFACGPEKEKIMRQL